jgi:radical SAM protein (TIGR01212 family)
MNTPYLSYKAYMIARYGEPLFRVPIDFGLGCPHRAADGSGGCAFCNERGARAVQTLKTDSVEAQMAEAIRFARDRYGAKKYMAYIQAFTATFEPKQQEKYLKLLQAFDFTAVSFGTRPDSLTPTAYTFLAHLNQKTETWVELGVQTVHDRTLKRIHRGHDWKASRVAIEQLHKRGIKVAVHIILGLPGETKEDFQQTAQTLAALPIDGIKIHNLHLEQGTTLAENPPEDLPLFMEHEFAEHVMDFIRRTPPHIPIMRLTTDTLKEQLIAPKWHMSKGQFKTYLTQQMICREWSQGDLSEKGVTENPSENQEEDLLKTVSTSDGSITFWNEEYKEHYHTPAGAHLEAEEKYLRPAQLEKRLKKGHVQLLDVCFGLGYNSLCAINLAEKSTSSLSITALEMDRRVVGAAAKKIRPSASDQFDWKQCLQTLYEGRAFQTQKAVCQLHWGDARYTLTRQPDHFFDVVFLDAFSTQRNSELWTVDFFKKLKAVMKPDAVLLTYCAALPVRAGLIEAGFFVGETTPVGRKRGGTLAALQEEKITIPLLPEELKTIRETTRGIPYRDPHGIWSNKEILRNRQEQILQKKRD